MSNATDILYSTPDNPVPDNCTSGTFKGYKGINLRYAVFRTDRPQARGTVVLLHGRNESIEKYYETIRDLNAHGLWVATYDMRGQAGSDRMLKDRRKGYVRRFSHYVRDLELFLEHIVLPDTRLPFYLLAHSTGGLVALSAAPRLANRIDRMVLTAPFVGLGPQPISPAKVFWLARLMCWTGFGGRYMTGERSSRAFEDNPLTSDIRRFRRNLAIFDQHPEMALGPPTARWIYECLKEMRKVTRPTHLYTITVPTVLISPVRDSVVSYPAQEAMAQYFRAAQYIPVPGARHEILQERDRYRAQAIEAIKAFIPGSDLENAFVDGGAELSGA
ncbi:alpha/beta hydrolase [Ciceribacter sp. L1K23]|uniref:alpha/beta fold hydrolase n=1 Tax=Ciceribacter sp. L1K23 TaxID=2820276 RepID=UPI001B832069|nr:alpha/beta hydrolase [Ciceribacter sp. L1K23]MBR0558253.1 alpha/beta hydrolase [Ciceribacter sp. L1K23]